MNIKISFYGFLAEPDIVLKLKVKELKRNLLTKDAIRIELTMSHEKWLTAQLFYWCTFDIYG